MSTLTPEQLAYMQAHYNDTRVPVMFGTYITAIAIAVLSTAARITAKRYTRNGLGVEDVLAVLATVCVTGESIVNFITGVPNGLGRHIIVVKSDYALEQIQKGEFVFTQLNDVAVYFVKMTILTFYYRVFPSDTFRKVNIGMMIFQTLWIVSVWGVTTFGCWPIQKWWSDVDGHCVNLVPFGIAANAIQILTDFFIFLSPVPILVKLKVSIWRRLMLIGVFSLGLGVCVLSVVRVINIAHIKYVDFTWENIPSSALYVFEPVGGLLCINVPFVARAIRRKYLSSHENGDSGGSGPYEKHQEEGQVRQRRGSKWLQGIDSIQLSNFSSRRGSDALAQPSLPTQETKLTPVSESKSSDEDRDDDMRIWPLPRLPENSAQQASVVEWRIPGYGREK